MLMKELRKAILISLLFFVLAAGLGLALRWAFVLDMPLWFSYRNIQHAHSHVALLGWLFAIFALFIIYFLKFDFKRYKRLYYLLQFSVLGMLVTFPVVGYNPISITFSTAHIILSYIFAYKIWKDINRSQQKGTAVNFIKTSLFFMVLSTLGTWALGPIMALGMKGSAIYYASIQFYLHFQFNGWFVFALLGLAFAMFQRANIPLQTRMLRPFYNLLVISAILTYALAVTWSTPYLAIFITNSVGVIIQLLAIYYLIMIVRNNKKEIVVLFPKYVFYLFALSFIALILKVIIQAVVVIPYMAEVSYTIRNFVIGFIHLLMLACLSLFAVGGISKITGTNLSTGRTWVFIIGILASEALLFVQGIMFWQGWGFMPSYYLLLGLASGIMLLGLIWILIDFFFSSPSVEQLQISKSKTQ